LQRIVRPVELDGSRPRYAVAEQPAADGAAIDDDRAIGNDTHARGTAVARTSGNRADVGEDVEPGSQIDARATGTGRAAAATGGAAYTAHDRPDVGHLRAGAQDEQPIAAATAAARDHDAAGDGGGGGNNYQSLVDFLPGSVFSSSPDLANLLKLYTEGNGGGRRLTDAPVPVVTEVVEEEEEEEEEEGEEVAVAAIGGVDSNGNGGAAATIAIAGDSLQEGSSDHLEPTEVSPQR
jgi:hypothetical protein